MTYIPVFRMILNGNYCMVDYMDNDLEKYTVATEFSQGTIYYKIITAQGFIDIAPYWILEGSRFMIIAPYRILEGSGFMISAPYQRLEGSRFMDSAHYRT